MNVLQNNKRPIIYDQKNRNETLSYTSSHVVCPIHENCISRKRSLSCLTLLHGTCLLYYPILKIDCIGFVEGMNVYVYKPIEVKKKNHNSITLLIYINLNYSSL